MAPGVLAGLGVGLLVGRARGAFTVLGAVTTWSVARAVDQFRWSRQPMVWQVGSRADAEQIAARVREVGVLAEVDVSPGRDEHGAAVDVFGVRCQQRHMEQASRIVRQQR